MASETFADADAEIIHDVGLNSCLNSQRMFKKYSYIFVCRTSPDIYTIYQFSISEIP